MSEYQIGPKFVIRMRGRRGAGGLYPTRSADLVLRSVRAQVIKGL